MITKLHQEFQVSFRYDVWFTHQLFAPSNPLLAETIMANTTHHPAKLFFVIDSGVAETHLHLVEEIKTYVQAHPEAGYLCALPMIVPGGEICKNSRAWVDQLLQAVNDYAIDRHSFLIAIGGGAVLDMAGFAASIAHRGVRHIRIPTTVLAQNDSGIGVKNAVNFFGKKNFIGCFTPPNAVINDFSFLSTLGDRDWRSGISEAIKVSLIKDYAFFEFLEQHAFAIVKRDMKAMERLIIDCAHLHMEHIRSGDPFESGSSRPLDFGHWAAHKLEQLTHHAIRHGEAVAVGIALDSTYSYLAGLLEVSKWNRILHLIQDFGFDIYLPELEADGLNHPLLNGLEEFREHLGGRLTIMLLEDLGKGIEVHEMDPLKIIEAAEILKQRQFNAHNQQSQMGWA